MPEYLSPGVYVEEVSYRGKPIEGVSTSTAGFVGRARKGPEGVATPVTSFAEFVRTFGDPYSAPVRPQHGEMLGHAMRSFFENGGRRAFVVRVLDDAASASELTLSRGVVARLRPSSVVESGATELPLTSLRGISTGAQLRALVSDGSGPPVEISGSPYTVVGYDTARSTVRLSAGVSRRLDARTTHLTRLTAAPVPTGPRFVARSRGAGGDAIRVEITPADGLAQQLHRETQVRERPELDRFGAAPTGAVLTLSALARMALVRAGDRVRLERGALSRDVTVAAVGPAVVTVTAGTPTADNSAAPRITRTVGAVTASYDAPVLTATDDIRVGAAPDTIEVPHRVGALLHPGDTLTVGAVVYTVGTITLSRELTLAAPIPGTESYAGGVLRLDTTPGRLLVASAAGFVAPRRGTSDEPVEVSVEGSPAAVATTIEWVDAVHGVLLHATTPALYDSGPPVRGLWTSVSSRHVGSAGTTFRLRSIAGLYTGAIVELDTGAARSQSVIESIDATARTVTLAASLGAGHLEVGGANPPTIRVLEIDVRVYEGGALVESFPRLTWNSNPVPDSWVRNFVEVVNAGSRLVRLDAYELGAGLAEAPTTATGAAQALAGGSDGADPVDRHFVGRDLGPTQRTGIEALKTIEDISIVAAPGLTSESVQGALITHAELMRYRIAVLDSARDDVGVNELRAHRGSYDSKYAAYYAPWIEVMDPANGRPLVIPPSGAVVGIYARSDNERGVHKAPANEVVRGITGLRANYTMGEQDLLNPQGVNLIRELSGRGTRVWGARTVSSDPEWKYVNVRRLFIFLEASIDRGTQWVVFEPNNEALWARVKSTVDAFLFGVWKTGALMGTKADDAYFVRCDRSTMTQNDIDNGRLVVTVGVAPSNPAEFVIFRIGQFTATASS